MGRNRGVDRLCSVLTSFLLWRTALPWTLQIVKRRLRHHPIAYRGGRFLQNGTLNAPLLAPPDHCTIRYSCSPCELSERNHSFASHWS